MPSRDSAWVMPWPTGLPLSEQEFPCPYLPGKLARVRSFATDMLSSEDYGHLLEANFRRCGPVIYRPVCHRCQACKQIRVPVDRFRRSRSQRRCCRRNQDLQITIEDRPVPTREKFDLYRKYVTVRHGSPGSIEWDSFRLFLYESPVRTIEMCYRDQSSRLLAVGICDIAEDYLSSVYLYFEPEEKRRSLGTFGALHELTLARSRQIPYYYLGYWIADCPSMNYKARFRPCQILQPDGTWTDPWQTDPPPTPQ